MTDIALVYDPALGAFDLALDPATGDLGTDEGLFTAVMIALFTDARAADDEALPVPGAPRRGWWGDALAADGEPWGSKLWLLARGKATAATAARAKAYAEAALAWAVRDKIAARIEVAAEAHPADNRIALAIAVTRPSGERIEYRWRNLWEAMTADV